MNVVQEDHQSQAVGLSQHSRRFRRGQRLLLDLQQRLESERETVHADRPQDIGRQQHLFARPLIRMRWVINVAASTVVGSGELHGDLFNRAGIVSPGSCSGLLSVGSGRQCFRTVGAITVDPRLPGGRRRCDAMIAV